MFKQVIEYIMDTALKHKAVKQAKYQKRSYINAQNNNRYIQFIIEDDPFAQYLRESNVFTITYNIDILGFPTDEYSSLQIQSDAFQIGNEILKKIDRDGSISSYLTIWDYSFLSLSNFTDDNASGQRLTLELVVPTPVNICTLDDNFNDEPYVEETDKEIDLKDINPPSKENELILKPIKLK